MYSFIIAGCFFMGTALNCFLEPNNMVTGGATGLSIIFERLFNLPMWLGNLIINIPLFLLGFKIFGIKFVRRSLGATIMLSVFLYITQIFPTLEGDYILGAVFGGALSGIGIGFIFRGMATTGGSDLAAAMINKYFPHIPISRIMLIIDSVIIIAGMFIFGVNITLYGILAVFITTKAIDFMVDGGEAAKGIFIISDKSEEIVKMIGERLRRGATYIEALGGYRMDSKKMVFCVVSVKQIPKLKEIVNKADSAAFFSITDMKEVIGEGFKSA